MKPHTKLVIQVPHDLDLLYQTLFSFVFTIGSFFRKRFYSKIFAIFKLFCQVNRCKITFSNLLLRFKLFVETSLIKFSLQDLSACLKIRFWLKGILGFLLLLLKSNCVRRDGKSILEIEIEWHQLSSFRCSFNQTFVIKWQSELPFRRTVSRAWIEQLSNAGWNLWAEHGCYCFHFILI